MKWLDWIKLGRTVDPPRHRHRLAVFVSLVHYSVPWGRMLPQFRLDIWIRIPGSEFNTHNGMETATNVP